MNTSPAMASLDDFLNLDSLDTAAAASSSSSAALPSVLKDDLSDLFSPHLTDSPASPASATTAYMPPNSPPQPQTALDTLNPNHAVFSDLYRTYIEPLKAASSAYPPAPLGEGAFSFADLFANYGSDALFQPITAVTGATPAAASSTLPTATLPSLFPFTIDPALVATSAITGATSLTTTAASLPQPSSSSPSTSASPAPPTAPTDNISKTAPRASTASIADDDSEDDDDEDDDDLPPLPVRGKKAGAKKSTTGGVATGGIVKRTGATSCVVRDADSNDPDDWRPTPEEYKKLSSKEKRQLRNKISARNFRVRRKEYITTLEGQISDRDKLIGAIRDELGAQKLENAELRQEIDNLKKIMLEGRVPHPTGLPPPETSPTSTATKPNTRPPLAKVNRNKDISAAGSTSFWAGTNSGMGGVTPVHTTIVPDIAPSLASVLSGKAGALNGGRWIPMSTATLGTLPGYAARSTQENINPNLNSVFRFTSPGSPNTSGSDSAGSPPPSSSGSESGGPSTPPMASCDVSPLSLVGFNQQQMQQWNGLGDINPFTIKSLDSYRLQLWAKMAAAGQLPPGFLQQQVQQQQQQQPQPLQQAYSTSLASQLRPAFFETEKDAKEKPASSAAKVPSSPQSLSALMAGKAASSLSSSSSSSSSTVPSTPTPAPSAQVHLAAALASQSLVSRMGSAFWDAFGTGSGSSAANKTWDMEKVRKVLEGKAVLKVVDVDHHPSPKVRPDAGLGSIEEKMRGLSLTTGMTQGEREREQAHRPGGVLKHLLK